MADLLIRKNINVLGGTPVFSGTRFPVRILLEHLEAGDRLYDYLQNYPTISREHATAVLKRAAEVLGEATDEAAA